MKHHRMRHQLHRPPHRLRPANGSVPRRKVVLILEDCASVGGLIAGLVRQEGYRVARAWSLAEALQLARGRRPDLVLLDLGLVPDEGGLGLLRELRQDEATRRVPLVLVAGSGLPVSDEERALLDDLVVKPFDIDVMLNALRKALGDPVVDVEPRFSGLQDYYLHGY